MYVRVVTFELDGIKPEQYEEHSAQIAEVFLDWPGLIAKVWLRDSETSTAGGVYLFESKDAADLSRSTDVFVGMFSNPGFRNVTVREYDTLDAATAVTARSIEPTAVRRP
jgi:hypothetical protein